MMSGLFAIAAACRGPAVTNGPVFGTGVFHPPPKPGDSISHTLMCECKSCNPRDCCDGPEDEPATESLPNSCAESYDFSAPGCAAPAIRSCASRCTRQVWRVHSGEDCAAKRPPSCCEAG
jgi:hypothetical protein